MEEMPQKNSHRVPEKSRKGGKVGETQLRKQSPNVVRVNTDKGLVMAKIKNSGKHRTECSNIKYNKISCMVTITKNLLSLSNKIARNVITLFLILPTVFAMFTHPPTVGHVGHVASIGRVCTHRCDYLRTFCAGSAPQQS